MRVTTCWKRTVLEETLQKMGLLKPRKVKAPEKNRAVEAPGSRVVEGLNRSETAVSTRRGTGLLHTVQFVQFMFHVGIWEA